MFDRPDPDLLLRVQEDGFERLPKLRLSYRGSTQEEFDIDAALTRKPSLVLVDELAHTNVPGSRNAKRWQDVEELLEAGIDVYSTLNVQHLESMNDVVARITGIVVRETLPDSVFDGAHKVKLVDLSPEELLERLREGKSSADAAGVNSRADPIRNVQVAWARIPGWDLPCATKGRYHGPIDHGDGGTLEVHRPSLVREVGAGCGRPEPLASCRKLGSAIAATCARARAGTS